MTRLFEHIIARLWNWRQARRHRPKGTRGLELGLAIADGQVSKSTIRVAHTKRAEHLAILGRTGTGKSSLLRHFAVQDIRDDRGFVYFDLHGDTTPFLLTLVAGEERRRQQDLSKKLIVIEPADPEFSIGFNVLERRTGWQSFVQISEFAEILKQRWRLDSFGARTEELLRNTLYVLSECGLTLLEMVLLLTDAAFRATCVRQVRNDEVRSYFESRYDQTGPAMQAAFRDAVLNKVSAFTADPHFRHILGQSRSSFSLVEAIDQGFWVILNLDKGRLGEQAATLGSLFLAQIKNALFSRRHRESLFTLYCDEIQNLIAYDSGLDTLLSEARKFGISIASANQFLDQYPPQMRSAVMAVGTHILFQLSSADAEKMAGALDGGRPLSELLRNLPQRHMVVKSGHHRWIEARVPHVTRPSFDPADLHQRCRVRWARRRVTVENDIRERQSALVRQQEEALRDWE